MDQQEQLEPPTIGGSSHVRFTAQEFKQIKKVQHTTGETIPTLLKSAFFKCVTDFRPLMDRESAMEVLRELKRIGNNINQITRHLNAGFGFESYKGFPGICDELSRKRKTIVDKSGISKR